MKFNLSKKKSGLAAIRKACPEIKPDDLDGASEEEIVSLAARIEKQAFGPGGSLGPSWTQLDPSSPYGPRPMTQAVPQFGGGTFDKQRQTLPFGTNNQTNKSQNSDEQTRGTSDDAIPELKRLRMMERERASLPDPDAEYVVSFRLRPWDDPEELKKRLSDEEVKAETDGVIVRAVYDSYEKALQKQRGFGPGLLVTRRTRRTQ